MAIHRTLMLAAFLVSTSIVSAQAASSHGGHHQGESAANGAPGEAANVSRDIEIVMGDNFYNIESLDVGANETVRFLIKNDGEFVHEFNIGTADMHLAHQGEMMLMVAHGVLELDHINRELMSMDMGGGKTMEHNNPNSVLLEPGESAELIWTFPVAGQLEFACNVPGHYESGMVGTLILNRRS